MATFSILSDRNFELHEFIPLSFPEEPDEGSLASRLVYTIVTDFGTRTFVIAGTGLDTGEGTIHGIELFDEDGTTLVAAFTGLSLAQDVLEDALRNAPYTPRDIFTLILRGDDTIVGNDYNNELVAGSGNDVIDGGEGFDDLIYRAASNTNGLDVVFTSEGTGTVRVNGTDEVDTFTGIEAVHGTEFNDSFIGHDGFQRFRGFGGNDTFDGGAGDDEVDYRNDATIGGNGVVINLANIGNDGFVTVSAPNGDTDKLKNIEFLRGTRNNDELTGNSLANRLRGDSGNDALDGGAGNDTLDGGLGNDRLNGGGGDDVLIGGSGQGPTEEEDWFEGSAGNDTIYGGDIGADDDPNLNWNALNYRDSAGITGIVVTFGSEARSGTVMKTGANGGTDIFHAIDAVYGTGGADRFIGGTGSGNQRFIGFAGNDVFDGTNGINEVDYRAEARAVNLSHGLYIDLQAGSAKDATGHTDTLIAIERVRGTEQSDTIIGNDLDNRLRGDKGNDTLLGGVGNDTLDGGLGNDILDGGDGDDLLIGGSGQGPTEEEDRFEGSAGNDTIYGGDIGADDDPNLNWNVLSYRLGGFEGIRVVFGDMSRSGTVQKFGGGGGTDTFYAIDVVFGTDGADEFIGGTGSGNQRFVGFAGNDLFDGTNGINEVDYRGEARAANRTEGMVINLSVGHVTDAFGDLDTLIAIERVRGTEFADTIIGNNLDNRLRGDSGDDTLDGGLGNDTLDGGLGSDTLDGGGGDDVLIGGSRVAPGEDNDWFEGSAGNDTIHGGDVGGADDPNLNWNALNYRNAVGFTGITVTFGETSRSGTVVKTGGGGGTDTFFAVDAVFGTDGADTFIGGAGSGNQRFIGFAGNDTFDGSLGVNEVDYRREGLAANLTTGLVIDLTRGQVTDAFGDTDTLIGIERVRGTDLADTITGDNFSNRLRGVDGNDKLSGGLGNDTLEGGLSNDTLNGGDGVDYAVYSGSRANYTFAMNSAGQVVVTDRRAGGDGQDIISGVEYFDFVDARLSLAQLNITTASSVTLPDGVVNLVASGSANVRITGNALSNSITGNSGSNVIDGGSGNDRISGGSGNDKVYGGTGNDVLDANTGNDTLYGGTGNDSVYGGSGSNRLYGDSGNDKIYSGAGSDRLYGGTGRDIFVFDANKPSKSKNLDTLYDYKAKDDSIWLDNKYLSKLGKGTEANPGKLNKKFFTIGDKAKDKDDYLIYSKKTKTLYYDADGSGSKKAAEIFKFSKDVSKELKYTEFFIV